MTNAEIIQPCSTQYGVVLDSGLTKSALVAEAEALAAQLGEVLLARVHGGEWNPFQYWSPGEVSSGDAVRQAAEALRLVRLMPESPITTGG